MPTDKKVNNKNAAPEKRRRRLPADARDNILAAAEAILTQRGPQHLKLADVAKAADIATATVLHHFTSIDGVQAALMERMVTNLVARIIDITEATPNDAFPGLAGMHALFDAFEQKGAARLAAWLVLTGEAPRLSGVRRAIADVIDRTIARDTPAGSRAIAEEMIMASITMALGAGLFGPSLSVLLGRAENSASLALQALLESRIADLGVIG